MSIGLTAALPAVVGLALNRFDLDFSERDRAVLNQIRPHVAQSWRLAREHARLRAMVDTAADALAAEGSAVVLLTNPIHELTPGAMTDLYRFFGRPPATTALPHRVHRWLERERTTVSSAGVGELARPLAASRSGRRLVTHSATAEDAPSQLAILGLSTRESEVLSQLTTGATNAEIATHLHLAPSTVKRHLDHIYLKLGGFWTGTGD